MRAFVAPLFTALLCGSIPFLPAEQDHWDEPPLELLLELDGVQHELVLGKRFDLKIGEASHALTVTAKASRFFDKAGLRLRYPSEFLFGFDDELEGCDIYTLEGAETLIMIQVYADVLDPVDVVDATVEVVMEELSPFEIEFAKSKITLAGKEFETQELHISLQDGSLIFTQNYFAFPMAQGTCVICLQYGYDDDGVMAEESRAAMNLLEPSFAFDPAK